MQDYPSWYNASSNKRTKHPVLQDKKEVDVCIVGGGYTGLSAALELCQNNVSSVLLEAEQIGYGASGRNGGQICSDFRLSVHELARYFGMDQAKLAWQAVEDAKRLMQKRIEDHSIQCDLKWGYLNVALHQRDIVDFQEMLDEWNMLGYEHGQMVGQKDIQNHIDSKRYIGGLIDNGAGHLHPLNYALGLCSAACKSGLEVFEHSPAVEINHENGWVRTPQGIVHAQHIIVACNGYIDRYLSDKNAGDGLKKIKNRIIPLGSYILATEPLSKEFAMTLIAQQRAVCDNNNIPCYYRMSNDNRLLFGGRESNHLLQFDHSGNGDEYKKDELAALMRPRMEWVFPQLKDVRIDYCWGGTLGITANRMVDMGRFGKRGFYAQGYSGQGVLVSNLAGKLIADAIVNASNSKVFDILSSMPHYPIPANKLFRQTLLSLSILWFKMRDAIG